MVSTFNYTIFFGNGGFIFILMMAIYFPYKIFTTSSPMLLILFEWGTNETCVTNSSQFYGFFFFSSKIKIIWFRLSIPLPVSACVWDYQMKGFRFSHCEILSKCGVYWCKVLVGGESIHYDCKVIYIVIYTYYLTMPRYLSSYKHI